MQQIHWPQVREIFEEGITTGHATLETEAPGWEEWDNIHLKECRLIAESEGSILGWAALSPVSGRCTYAGVAEVSIYISESNRDQGVGRILLEALVRDSEKSGIWTLQAGIFPENEASIQLHINAGFREVGIRERIGKVEDGWRDILLMERRSPNF